MAKMKMARLTESEWRLLRGVRAREAMTRRVLAREAEARPVSLLAAEAAGNRRPRGVNVCQE